MEKSELEEEGYVLVQKKRPHKQDVVQNTSKEYLAEIEDYIQKVATSIWHLNNFIHENPELAFQEYKAHRALTGYMRSRKGWHVTMNAYGMETAWVAVYDSGKAGPVVSFNAEMAELMEAHSLAGKILLFGTPGEEGFGGGKIRLLEAGAYSGVDVSLISHPGISNNSAMVRTTAFARLEVEFFGRAAHAARSPWAGINALDALVIAYNSISALRQRTMLMDVIGMSITNGGGPPNIIHPYASGVCVIRAASASRLEELQRSVSACFRAGAEATGAKVNIKITPGYADHVPNSVLAASYNKYWSLLPDPPEPPIPPPGQFTWVKASTDQGNISYAMPSVNASFAIPPGAEGGQPHSPDFEKASGTKGAFERALRVAKALAGTAVDVLATPGLIDRVKEQWRRDMDSMKTALQSTVDDENT
ncbi:uncharacterized protein EI97DRAFT_413127 [Westerdykella ornata]|uniref:Peptidase M20 domain-containing protein 2 n=1 Tax=Westerdykella ornata TaxID=318751 RepID=A0A6A6JU81_WESOR|nr:uncharacterized protein EI97DRAFT_413127 [Westerdykella ornata]KAF2279784.1 hypothetical protein EI97DRAFT_413127 [Westerdykella ornata]